jgi:hypothetical protein
MLAVSVTNGIGQQVCCLMNSKEEKGKTRCAQEMEKTMMAVGRFSFGNVTDVNQPETFT